MCYSACMTVPKHILERGFRWAVWEGLNIHVKNRIRRDRREVDGRPVHLWTPSFPPIIREKFEGDLPDCDPLHNEFALLQHCCEDNQQFVDYLGTAIVWIKKHLLIQNRELRIFLSGIDMSRTKPVIDFGCFEMENCSFDWANLTKSRFKGAQFKRNLPRQVALQRNYTGAVSFYMANIGDTEIPTTFGKVVGFDQFQISGGLGNAGTNSFISITYPGPAERGQPCRIFVDREELTPEVIIETGIELFAPNSELAFKSNQPMNVFQAVAKASHRKFIFTEAIARASRVDPNSVQIFEQRIQQALLNQITDQHSRFTVWRGLTQR